MTSSGCSWNGMRLCLGLGVLVAASACASRARAPEVKIIVVETLPQQVRTLDVKTDAIPQLTKFWRCLQSSGQPVLTATEITCLLAEGPQSP